MFAVVSALSVSERRRRRRLLALTEGLDERGRAIWGPVADRIAEYEARVGGPVPDAVRQHFAGAGQALRKKDGRRALAALRQATVRMVIALRPLVRAHPEDMLLAQALADVLVVRDQVVARVAEHQVALVAFRTVFGGLGTLHVAGHQAPAGGETV
ncbi:hypothetical protein AB0D46_25020 [Streptomyces sp. NPDC048383]|uniref:hypothetical protein n=1 Tax=Streptomyces sp. NPDC048383 TaxID=3155386 RepID=UPI00342C9539